MPLATLSPPKIPDSFSFPNIYFNEHLIVFSLSLFSQIVSHFKYIYIYIYIFFKFHSQNQTTTTKIIRKKCVNMYSILLGCSTIFIFVPLLHFSRSNCVLLTDNWTPFCVARAMLFFFMAVAVLRLIAFIIVIVYPPSAPADSTLTEEPPAGLRPALDRWRWRRAHHTPFNLVKSANISIQKNIKMKKKKKERRRKERFKKKS